MDVERVFISFYYKNYYIYIYIIYILDVLYNAVNHEDAKVLLKYLFLRWANRSSDPFIFLHCSKLYAHL